MKTIWKFVLEMADEQRLVVPMGARFLCIQLQNDRPCVWAEVDTESQRETVTIHIAGTGHHLPEPEAFKILMYLGTIQQDGFVWHIYYEVPRYSKRS